VVEDLCAGGHALQFHRIDVGLFSRKSNGIDGHLVFHCQLDQLLVSMLAADAAVGFFVSAICE
jgi:hypothetical protein